MGFSNSEIVTIALYLVGGDTKPTDTEDIAIQANKLSTGRFTWIKYEDQINLTSVRKGLWDATREKTGRFVSGSDERGWFLTQKGVEFAKRNVDELSTNGITTNRLSARQRKWKKNEYKRLIAEPAYLEYKAGNIENVTEREAEAFFRLNEYITGDNRIKKIQRIVNAFGDDSDLGEIVRQLSNKIQKK